MAFLVAAMTEMRRGGRDGEAGLNKSGCFSDWTFLE
jgi:hypothetical protein